MEFNLKQATMKYFCNVFYQTSQQYRISQVLASLSLHHQIKHSILYSSQACLPSKIHCMRSPTMSLSLQNILYSQNVKDLRIARINLQLDSKMRRCFWYSQAGLCECDQYFENCLVFPIAY